MHNHQQVPHSIRRGRRNLLTRAAVAGVLISAIGVSFRPALAWNAHGHRLITLLALDALPAEAPEWLRDSAVRARAAYQSNEADRWRGTRIDPIGQENKPDHFLDVELLEQFGLTLETTPPLRYDYLRAMAVSKHLHPEKVDPHDAERDSDHSKEWPGFLPHAIAEHYAKLISAFNTVRILESLKEPARSEQLEMARANAIYHMGMLSHFVGDAAQPLHTTRHYNGWTGGNPKGYTTSNRFHSEIDGGVLRRHRITYASMKAAGGVTCREINGRQPWNDIIAHIRRSFDQMEPLYALEKSGELNEAKGMAFIEQRLADGASMLSGMIWAAWRQAEPTPKQVEDFVRYNEMGSEQELGGEGAPQP